MNIRASSVRPALIQDARQIAEMHIAAWRVAYAGIVSDDYLDSLSVDDREQGWSRMIERRTSNLWIAECSERITGLVSFGSSREADAPPALGEVMAIYVHPEFWSCGIGRSLWHATREQLQRQGFSMVMLWVLEKNARARQFYRAEGFAEKPDRDKVITIGGNEYAELYCEISIGEQK